MKIYGPMGEGSCERARERGNEKNRTRLYGRKGTGDHVFLEEERERARGDLLSHSR